MVACAMRDTGETRKIRLAELLGALCHALDMTEGQPEGHCIRCCWIGVKIGQEIGLDERRTLGTLLHAAAQGSRLQQQCGAHLPALPDRRSDLQVRLQADRRQPAPGPALRAVPHRSEGRPRRAVPGHHQHFPERRRDRPGADRDALPPRRRHRPQDAVSRSGGAGHPEPGRTLGRRRQAHRGAGRRHPALRADCVAGADRGRFPCRQRRRSSPARGQASLRHVVQPGAGDGLRARSQHRPTSGTCCAPRTCQGSFSRWSPHST